MVYRSWTKYLTLLSILVEMVDHPFQYDKAIFTLSNLLYALDIHVNPTLPHSSWHISAHLWKEVVSQMKELCNMPKLKAAWLGMTVCADRKSAKNLEKSGMSFLQNPNFWAMKFLADFSVKFTHHSKFSDWIFAVFGCRTSMPAPSLASLARGCRAGMNYSVMHKSCVREPQDPERNAEAAEVMLAEFKGKLSGISEMTTLRWRKESWWLSVRQVHDINVLAALWLTLSVTLS